MTGNYPSSNLEDSFKNKIYFTDKSLASNSASNITLAVILLVLGISLAAMLFYLLDP